MYIMWMIMPWGSIPKLLGGVIQVAYFILTVLWQIPNAKEVWDLVAKIFKAYLLVSNSNCLSFGKGRGCEPFLMNYNKILF